MNRIKFDNAVINIYNSHRCRYGNENPGINIPEKSDKELIGQRICTVSDKDKTPRNTNIDNTTTNI